MEAFLNGHECSAICKNLDLATKDDLSATLDSNKESAPRPPSSQANYSDGSISPTSPPPSKPAPKLTLKIPKRPTTTGQVDGGTGLIQNDTAGGSGEPTMGNGDDT
jgi:hypothetical protein